MNARLERIGFMPLKSGGEMELEEALIGPGGLVLRMGNQLLADREFVVAEEGRSGRLTRVTQREDGHMVAIQPILDAAREALILAFEGEGELVLPLGERPQGETESVHWSGQKRYGREVSPVASEWMSRVIGRDVKLLRSPMPGSEIIDRKVDTAGAFTHFADVWQFSASNQATLDNLNAALRADGRPEVGIERFRSNLHMVGWKPFEEHDIARVQFGDGEVVMDFKRPSPRCKMPSVDPNTGKFDRNPAGFLKFLKEWHRDGKAFFGENVGWVTGMGHRLHRGMPVSVKGRRS